MKKLLSAFLVSSMMATMLVGCGGSQTEQNNQSEEALDGEVTAQTLLIGGSGPLTGDYATYGISVKEGAEIAVNEINAAGGVNGIMLQVRMEDDQADPAIAKSAYATLFDAGMKVSLGGVTSGACIAAADEANYDGMLMITPSGSQKECVDNDNAFRICFNDPDQGKYAANFIFENEVSNNVAILFDSSNDYSNGITQTFVDQAEEIGLEIVAKESFTSQSNTDFSAQLQKIKSSGADLVFLPIYAQEASYILTQADKAGIDVAFFGCDGLDGILQKIGDDNIELTEGLMLLTPFAADSTEPVVANFTASYQAAYNKTPDQFAADGYDAIYAIKAALEAANITDINASDFNQAMISAMTSIEVEGTTGTMTWDASGEPDKTANAVVITDGTYVAFSK